MPSLDPDPASASISAPTPDRTARGKPHFEVLDGLRGTAAVMVVLFHIMGMPIAWADQGQRLHHAAMAVDFFFGLSGFVVAYAVMATVTAVIYLIPRASLDRRIV